MLLNPKIMTKEKKRKKTTYLHIYIIYIYIFIMHEYSHTDPFTGKCNQSVRAQGATGRGRP